MAELGISIFLCIIIFCARISAITNIDPERKEKIDNFVNSLLFECDRYSNVVGMNLAIVYEGDILYTTGYGVKNLETNEPVTEHTVYGIASVSKHFTTTLLGQTLKNTGYSSDTKVHDILADLGTEFYFHDPLRTNLITLRDLGSHFTGITRNDYLAIMQNMPRSEQVARLRFIEGVEEPRTTFRYNNLMFMLQGHITELLAGRSWEQLVQLEIYDKVGMVSSSFIYSINEESGDIATPYMASSDEPRKVDWQSWVNLGGDMRPAGGITSTANDMVRWMNMLMSGGLNEAGEEVFSSDVIREMQSPVNPHSAKVLPQFYPPVKYPVSYSVGSTYGLGLAQGSYRGYRTVMHGGNLFGHYSRLELFPDVNLGVYSSINGQEGFPGAMQSIGLFVADNIWNMEPWFNATTACTLGYRSFHKRMEEGKQMEGMEQNDVDVTMTLPSHMNHDKPKLDKVHKFLGQYGNFGYGNLTVVADDVLDELIINFDVYSCVVRNETGEHEGCVGLGIYWFLSLWRVQFDEESNPSQFVDVTFTVTEDPVRFERDLMLEDALEPRDHWPKCEEIFPVNI